MPRTLLLLLVIPCIVFNLEKSLDAGDLPVKSISAHFLELERPTGLGVQEVVRFDLDVTGDNIPEIFISSSETRGVAGQDWHIYSPVSRGIAPYRYLGDLFFHSEGFRYDRETGNFFIWVRHSGSEGSVAVYRIDADGVHRIQRIGPLISDTEEHEDQSEKMLNWQPPAEMKFAWVALEDFTNAFLKSTPLTWKRYEPGVMDEPIGDLLDISSIGVQ